GELISGQTIIVKTRGNTVEEALVREPGAIAATLSPWAQRSENKSPGTRGKMMAMLRTELIKAQEYIRKHEVAASKPSSEPTSESNSQDSKSKKDEGPPARDLHLEVLARVLKGEVPLMISANRAQDIDSVLRLADEFKIKVWLDSAAEAYLLTDS